MTDYQPADDDSVALLKRTMEKYRPDLVKARVRVSLIAAFAHIGDGEGDTGPAMKVRGHAILARVRIVPHRDRCQGLADAEIAIDGDRWAFKSERERIAIFHHELTHLELVRNDKNEVKLDGGSRPKLKIRHHDVEVGWFVEVEQEHGDHSVERQQAREIVATMGQLCFGFVAVEQPAEVQA